MLLRQMKFFIAVVECQSFSEAAERCFISQSAVSQQIKALESNLDTQLIKRGNRHFSLTTAGEYFFERAKKIVQEAEALELQLKQNSKAQKHSFKIGWRNGYNIRKLFSVINQILVEDDSINIEVSYGEHSELFEKLRKKELDIIFNDVRNEKENSYFCQKLLVNRPALVAVASRKPYTDLDYLCPENLQNSVCILLTNKDTLESEKSFYAQLYDYHGPFFMAESMAATVTQVINNNWFMPNYFGNDAKEFFGSITKLLPIKINNIPRNIKYGAFWNKDSENTSFNKIRDELIKRIPASHT